MPAWINTFADAVSIVYALCLAGGVLLCIRYRWKICAAAFGMLLALQLNDFVFPFYFARWSNAVAYGNDSSLMSVGELFAIVGSVKYIAECAAVMLLIFGLYRRLRRRDMEVRGTQDV